MMRSSHGMSTSDDTPILDHVAIAVHRWADGFPLLIDELGGAWIRGGPAGDFAPCQLAFEDEMKVELLEPGADGTGFVTRFLDRHGPSAHHITFDVPDLDQFVLGCRELGLDILPAHIDVPGRREAFVHPKSSGLGTLVQAIEDQGVFDGRMPAPAGFPRPVGPQRRLVWVALSVDDFDRAMALFVRILGGRLTDWSDARGRWGLVEWDPGRRLLVMDRQATRLYGRGDGDPGIDHVLFSRSGTSVPSPTVAVDRHAMASADALGTIIEFLAPEVGQPS